MISMPTATCYEQPENLKNQNYKNIDKYKFGGEIFAIYFWTLLHVKHIYTVNQILLNREKTSYL